MAVSTITLASDNGDSVVVSAPNDEYLLADIVLDTDPEGVYDTGFTLRTQSGAFENGGRIVGIDVPIRQLTLPFWLTPESRPRFQRLWGTPHNLRKVKATWEGASGPRHLILKLAKEIKYTTEDGQDGDIEKVYHAVVTALAVNPNYEGVEEAAQWTNPGNRFLLTIEADGGTFPLGFAGYTANAIPFNVSVASLKSRLEGLTSVGVGKVSVTGTPATTSTAGNFVIEFNGVTGTLTGTRGTLTADGFWGDIGWSHGELTITGQCVGWFEVWNPTDQPLWLEWAFDPAKSWWFPDFGFGQERKWNRAVGQDSARMIVSGELTQKLSVMSDPFMDTYVNADLSNAAGMFNGVEPLYAVPPYTGTEDEPILMPVVCNGPIGAKVTLRQRRFWSAESGLEEVDSWP